MLELTEGLKDITVSDDEDDVNDTAVLKRPTRRKSKQKKRREELRKKQVGYPYSVLYVFTVNV